MAEGNNNKQNPDTSDEGLYDFMVPLCPGPYVTIQVGDKGAKYKLYLNRIEFPSQIQGRCINAYIELARLADMWAITGMEQLLADKIKAVITSSIPRVNLSCIGGENGKIRHLTSSHIKSASMLFKGHPVRSLIAEASAGPFILMDNFKFARELRENANYAGDLLDELKDLIKGQVKDKRVITPYTLHYWKSS
ncbi:similar to An09g05000 [Aspergillus luchuensis IFO 4308]|nr:similar to An09g05000 [Aspergillus luchuensis IFO 4308]